VAPADRLTDDFDREVSGVRVSLTDRCNFDCVYCHNEGLGDTRGPMAPREHEMDADDVVRFLEVVREFGVEAVKFTGGEPTLREDLVEIVERTPSDLEVSMTTNATMLPEQAPALAAAGLERVNVSLDALDPETFAQVTQTGAFDQVLEGVEAALDAGLAPVKLNMVLLRETAAQVPEMVDFVADRPGLRLQLLQYMPELTGNPEWAVDVADVHDWLEEQAARVETRDMHDRRRYWIAGSESDPGSIDDAEGGMVEVVDPVGNADFCANCHRVRVTHDGQLKGCLNRDDDHRSMGDMTRAEIRETFRETVSSRVPYYGAYLVEEEGEWVRNEEYGSTAAGASVSTMDSPAADAQEPAD
jgi:cyclic pyranopterin phosphate synthase